MNEDTRNVTRPHSRTHNLGLVLGPIIALGLYLFLGGASGLGEDGRRLASITALMAIWWITEAIPLAATALLPIVCFPVLRILPVTDTTANYGDKLIFLFMGGLMLGKGLERWGAHKRLALLIILLVGTKPGCCGDHARIRDSQRVCVQYRNGHDDAPDRSLHRGPCSRR